MLSTLVVIGPENVQIYEWAQQHQEQHIPTEIIRMQKIIIRKVIIKLSSLWTLMKSHKNSVILKIRSTKSTSTTEAHTFKKEK